MGDLSHRREMMTFTLGLMMRLFFLIMSNRFPSILKELIKLSIADWIFRCDHFFGLDNIEVQFILAGFFENFLSKCN